jgi:hypothetical protein
MVRAIAQRLGREADTEIEAIFQGSLRSVIRTDEGWRTLSELPKRKREWQDTYVMLPVASRVQPLWGLEEPDPFGTDPWGMPPVILAPPPSFPNEDEAQPYSNAQFGLAHPHEELAIIVSSHASLALEGDVVVGELTDVGAQLLLVREGQDHIAPVGAAGAFRLQLRKGLVWRYQLRLEGILRVERKRVHVRQASTTTLRDFGVTRFTVAEEARRKLAW